MKLAESCPCGATFEVNAEAAEANQAALGWRNTHKHEAWASEGEEE